MHAAAVCLLSSDIFLAHLLELLSGHFTGKTIDYVQGLTLGCSTVQDYPPVVIFSTDKHFPQFSNLFWGTLLTVLYATACLYM